MQTHLPSTPPGTPPRPPSTPPGTPPRPPSTHALPTDIRAGYDSVAHARRTDATELLRRLNNLAKSYLIDYAARLAPDGRQLVVLEKACGRLGDVRKWMHAAGERTLILHASDISPESIRAARERIPGSVQVHLTLDGQERAPVGQVHVVSLQMALHYFCASEQTLSKLLADVSNWLMPGGVFVCTFFHADSLARVFGSRSEFLGGDVRVTVQGDGKLGRRVNFFMRNAVPDLQEFAVPIDVVVRIADQCGLLAIRTGPLTDVVVRAAAVQPALALPDERHHQAADTIGLLACYNHLLFVKR